MAGFGGVLRVREFRALWLAEALSVCGDQIARVALALVVFDRTSSAALTALTYALTFVPAVLGGVLLSGLADRYPRRAVIVTTDLLRGLLAAAMAVPGLPLWLLWTLIGVLTLAAAPFKAAQLALLPDVLPGALFQAGMGLRQITTQAVQVAGFGLGGVLVTATGPAVALLGNAVTFLASAAVVVVFVRPRPAARATRASGPPAKAGPVLVAVYAFAAMIGFLVVPEGLAAPYASAAGVGSAGVGILMAADPVGSVLGGWWAARTASRPRAAPRSVAVPAALAGLPLLAGPLLPGPWWAAGFWAVSGGLSTVYLIRLQAAVVDLIPDDRRGTVMGRLSTCLYSSQGVAIVGAGLLAEQVGPEVAIAVSGSLATVTALTAAAVWRSTTRQEALAPAA
ncbi:MFS transporter [Amycolatopsis sp. NPDC051758]|uniref:MFS transporter n=1 Tax=Amycolatopsis sp. NPDC051758 TaxID=3363935 RepID=UPI003794D51B